MLTRDIYACNFGLHVLYNNKVLLQKACVISIWLWSLKWRRQESAEDEPCLWSEFPSILLLYCSL